MEVIITDKYAGDIRDFEKRKDLKLVTDSQDVRFIKNFFGNKPAIRDYDGFLVKFEDGEYKEIYAFDGIPSLDKSVFKIGIITKARKKLDKVF